jgi:hypothetical protein
MLSKKIFLSAALVSMAGLVACGDDSSSNSDSKELPKSVKTFMDLGDVECNADRKCETILVEEHNDTYQCDGVKQWDMLLDGVPSKVCPAKDEKKAEGEEKGEGEGDKTPESSASNSDSVNSGAASTDSNTGSANSAAASADSNTGAHAGTHGYAGAHSGTDSNTGTHSGTLRDTGTDSGAHRDTRTGKGKEWIGRRDLGADCRGWPDWHHSDHPIRTEEEKQKQHQNQEVMSEAVESDTSFNQLS